MQESVGDDFLVKLTALLREHGETLLGGTNKLCLTASSLIFLNQCFDELDSGINNVEASKRSRSYVNTRCVPYLKDFFRRAISLKLVPGTCSQFDVLINVSCFRALSVLEIKKVPVGYIRGLQSLRPQLVALTCTRSVHVAISEVFVSCGGDLVSTPIQWPQLEEVNLSYNGIEQLDDSLKLLPLLKVLNLSHNCILSPEDNSLWEHFSEISHINLGYNRLSSVPTITGRVINFKVTYLVLRNNNLHNLEGLQILRLLKMLDVSNNCITSISELSPLAHLHDLTSLYLEGNPISFHPDYRLNTVARLYPVPRYERIMLDGKPLTNIELPALGCSVQPESLLSYLPESLRAGPRGRPDMEHLTRDLVDSSLDDSSVSEEQRKRKKKSRKGRRAVAREICIEDTDDGTSTPDERMATPSAERVLEHAEDLRKLEKLRKLGGDDWLPGIDSVVNPEGNQVTEAINGHPSEAEAPIPLPRTLSKVSYTEEHYMGNSRSSSISVASLSDEDVPDDHRFLVTLASSGNDDESSPFFIFVKGQDLFETDFNGRVVCQLEVHLLRDLKVDETPDGQPVARLKFDYVNRNRQTREYVLEDTEECKHLIEILQPKMESNAEEKRPQVESMECLKCSAHFGKPQVRSSDVICPDCGGTTIIALSPPGPQDSSAAGLNVSSLKSLSSDMAATDLERFSSSPSKTSPVTSDRESGFTDASRSPTSQSSDTFTTKSDNFSVNQNVMKSASPARTSALSTSIKEATRAAAPTSLPEDNTDGQTPFLNWTPMPSVETNSLDAGAQANYAAGREEGDGVSFVNPSMDESLEADTLPHSLPSETKTNSSRFSTSTPPRKISGPLSRGARLSNSTPGKSTGPARISRSMSPNPNILKNLFSKLSGKMSGASGSSTDSRGGSSSDSRSSTPITRVPRFDFRISSDDFTNCDHRLKLYFEVSLFTGGANEEFRCILKTSVVIYGEFEEIDCVLVASNMMFYLCKLTAGGSGTPEDCLMCLATHSLDELQFIDYGLGKQSFRFEFSNGSGCYLFRVRDKVRCEKFMGPFLATVEQAKAKTCSKPVSVTKCNPQTLAHIRSQVLGVTEESALSLGRRLYEQALHFSDPPLIKDRKSLLRNYSHCFVGKEFVDWLLKIGEVDSREKAAEQGQFLLDGGALENVSHKEGTFEDKDYYYRFTEQSNSGEDEMSAEDSDSDLDTSVVLYLLAVYTTNIKKLHEDLRPIGVVVTRTHIALAEENPQWPIPRYKDGRLSIKGPEFVCVARHKITDVTNLDFYGDSPRYVGISISDEDAPLECADSQWLLKTETASCMSSLVQVIRKPWEAQFGVELQQTLHPALLEI